MATKPKSKLNKKASEKAKRAERREVLEKQKLSQDPKAQRKLEKQEKKRLKEAEKAREKRAKELEKVLAKRAKEEEKIRLARLKEAEKIRAEREKMAIELEKRQLKQDLLDQKAKEKLEKEEAKKAKARKKAEKEVEKAKKEREKFEIERAKEIARERAAREKQKQVQTEQEQLHIEQAKPETQQGEVKPEQTQPETNKEQIQLEANLEQSKEKPQPEKKDEGKRASKYAKLKRSEKKVKKDKPIRPSKPPIPFVASAVGKMSRLEIFGAYLITIMDIALDIVEWYATGLFVRIFRSIYALRLSISRNAHIIIRDAAIVIIGLLVLLIPFTSVTDYEYSYNGKVLGIVREQQSVLNILDLVSEELSKEYDSNIKINAERDIKFRTVFSMNKEVDNQDAVLNKLTHMGSIQTQAFGINVNGETVAIVESERIAQNVLRSVQELFFDPNEDYSEIGFVEDVQVEEIPATLSKILSQEDAIKYIKSGSVQAKEYTVVPGDTPYGIAQKNGLTYDEFKAMNPGYKESSVIHAGDKFKVQVEVPLVTVKTVGVSTFAETVPYDTEYRESSSYYKGEQIVTKAGKDGKQSVTATLTKENGKIVAREDISTEIIIQPTTRVVTKGTKDPPPRQGTGTFKKPVNYRINSGYGMRYGRMHKGVDMACPTGTPVRAADGGTVTMSRWYGDYGYCVQIDHGGGYSTLYGHNSKLAVKVGDKVYQGQIIAYAGSTGRSSGPHCHFEIMYLGKNVNPAKYI